MAQSNHERVTRASEVLNMGAKVEVTLEISAELPDGASDSVVRTVTENCRTLHFDSSEFEER